MPYFHYQCLDQAGRRVSGEVEAPDLNRCRTVLKEKGLFPVRLVPSRGADRPSSLGSRRGASAEVTLLLRQLASLLSSHIPVVDAVEAITPQIRDPRLRKTFHHLSDSLHRGLMFSDALRRERVFPEKLPELVAVSEASGTLGLVLTEFARTEEALAGLRRRVTSSLVYPFFLAGLSVLVLLFLFTVVLPRVTVVFTETGVALPAFTRAVVNGGFFLREYGVYLLVGLGLSFFYLRRSLSLARGREHAWALLRRVPLLAELSDHYCLSLFARNLAILTRGGVKLIEALRLVANILPDPFFQKAVARVEADLGRGSALGEALEKSPLFPATVVQLVRVGEKTGELPPMLERAAQSYEEELETRLTRAVALLEPTMIVLMGILVGAIVISVLLPIFEMSRIIG